MKRLLNPHTFLITLIMFGIASYAISTLSQLSRSYPLILSSFFLFYLFASYTTIVYRRPQYLLVLAIVIPLSIKTVMILLFSNEWFLANGDLIYMMKVSEKTIAKSHYPFNDVEISSVRPNYLEYPTSFLLQAMLSIISNINIDTLMLYSPASWAAYILVLLVALDFIIELRRSTTFESCWATYIMGLIIFNFLTISFPRYFVYSNIIRALIMQSMYMLMKRVARKNSRSKYAIMLLLLFFTSIVLGHSQEPIMLFLYLILLATALTTVKILRWGNVSDDIFIGIVQPAISFTILHLLINVFFAISTYSSAIMFISRLISNIVANIGLESLVEKEMVATQVLTRYELYILLIALLLNGLIILGILIRYLKKSLGKRDAPTLSAVIASSTFLVINGLIAFYRGIFSDLIFRPLWVFLCSLMPILMFEKSATDSANQNSRRTNAHFRRVIMSSLIVALSLFAVSNIIYSRYHVLTSEVYLHENLTVKTLGSLRELISTSDVLHNQVLIIDTPKYPSYEIEKALLLLTNNTYKTIIYLDPEVPNYHYSYLNGILKSRSSLKDINVITTLESCDSLELGKIFNSEKIYVLGQIKHCLQHHSSIILSINEDLGLGILHKQ
ncbi:MAG: hypothetical protein QW096_13340 [Thermofilaceae archaeon]